MRDFIKKYFKFPIINYFLLANCINFIIEAFSRESVIEAFKYLFTSPLVFFYNSFIILATLSIALIFRRRIFVVVLISSIWTLGGVTNFVILNERTLPFTATDIKLVDTALSIINNYLTLWQIVLIVIGLALLLVGLFMIVRHAPKCKNKINYVHSVATILIVFGILFVGTKLGLKSNYLSETFGNLNIAYNDYGFAYCFSNSLFNTGISKPSNYSEETVDSILEAEEAVLNEESSDEESSSSSTTSNSSTTSSSSDSSDEEDDSSPNIIFIQLESFFDPTTIEGVTYSEDPIPTFRSLMENYSSGYLSVPVVGAGTVNTEFEVLTGMNLDYFGPGEYPYKTILKETTSESLAYDLSALGYSTHAIHNNRGTFYSRSTILSQLGFDTFTSIEYMSTEELEYTPQDWAKDGVLTDEIMDTLNSTEEQDFIYTITVQSHGSYPTDGTIDSESEDYITVSGLDSEDETNAYTYYVNELKQVDTFISELIEELSNYDEDVILVMYGDHLPTLGLTDDDMSNGSVYQTEYVIWDNMGLEKEDEDLEAYQLGASVLSRLDMTGVGTLFTYHQTMSDTEDYEENLQILQYDMLYGNQYVYDETNPFEATDIQMGINTISVNGSYSGSYTSDDGTTSNATYITGENFTSYSVVEINGESYDTIYIDSNTLAVVDATLQDGDSLVVSQVTSTGKTLSSTEEYIYSAT